MKKWILQHQRHDIVKSGRHTKNASQSIKTEEIHHFVYFPVQKELKSFGVHSELPQDEDDLVLMLHLGKEGHKLLGWQGACSFYG